MNKMPLLVLPILAPGLYNQHRELLILAFDLLGMLGLAHFTWALDSSIVQQLYSVRHTILVPMLRQLLMPLRPPAAAVRWACMCPFMVSQVFCAWPLLCPDAERASSYGVVAAFGFSSLLLLISLVLSLVTDLATRRAFVRSLSYHASNAQG